MQGSESHKGKQDFHLSRETNKNVKGKKKRRRIKEEGIKCKTICKREEGKRLFSKGQHGGTTRLLRWDAICFERVTAQTKKQGRREERCG